MDIKIKQIVKYDGHNISPNGAVHLTVKAAYSELPRTIELNQLLNNDIDIKAKLPGESKPMKLGRFRIKQIIIDGDGESKLKFDGLKDYVEVDNLNLLPLNTDNVTEFAVQYFADVEVEEDEE